MKGIIVRCVSVLLVIVGAAVASASELGLITAGEHGTYYRLALDLKALVRPSGIDVKVYPSKGSVQNIYAIHQRRGIQLGIVQSDVLEFVADLDDPDVTRIVQNTRMLFPLHNEQVHVLARRGIGDFEELGGKRVAVGPEGSGAYLTARLLFRLADVAPVEIVPLDLAHAVAALKSGRVDAVVYVAAQPIRLLRDEVTSADGLELIPIKNKSIDEVYEPVEIPPDAYAWQPTPVTTVYVKAILVSSALSGEACETVGRFARQVVSGIDWLVEHGHPTWKAVDLEFRLRGWEQDPCVRKYVGERPAAHLRGAAASWASRSEGSSAPRSSPAGRARSS